jgi:hypothetical protein
MKTAIIVGSAMASFCVEKFGPTRLKEITRADIDARIRQFVDLVNFDIELCLICFPGPKIWIIKISCLYLPRNANNETYKAD